MIKSKLMAGGASLLFALAAIVFPVQRAHAVEYGCNGPDTFASASNGQGTAHATIRTCVEKNYVNGAHQIRAHSKISCYLSGIATACQEIGGLLTLWMQNQGVEALSPTYYVEDRKSLDMYTPYWCENQTAHTWYGKASGVQVTLPNGVSSEPHNHNSFPTFRNCDIII